MKFRTLCLTVLLSSAMVPAFAAVADQQKQQPTAYLVANAHLDTQWNWDIQKTINEYIPATLYRNLLLLEKFPDYVFNCESGIKYALMKEYYPEGYALLQKYINEGRWHISGSCWEATDANIPSPESLTRNILYGQRFYMSEFGVKSTDIFLPDCFGFGWQLPTIAAHCGLIGFSSQKLIWRELPFYGESKVPFEYGQWQGIDGSRLLTFLNPGRYGRKFQNVDISNNKEIIEACRKTESGINVLYYGTGDIGGSPTPSSVMAIEKGVHGNGPVKIISATSDQLFQDILKARVEGDNSRGFLDLPVFDGELTMDVHGTGCYTSQAAMKLLNRRNEQMADAAERASVAAEVTTGATYPAETLTEAWKRFIWHQFHDDLTGTSIPRAYEFSWNDEILSLKQFAGAMQSAVGAVAASMDTRVASGAKPVVIYNPSAFERCDVVTVEGNYQVLDEKKNKVATQREWGRTTFVAKVPALGFVVYEAKPVNDGVAKSAIGATLSGAAIEGAVLENSVYKVTLDKNGDFASIVDKRCGRELVEEGSAMRLAIFTDNKSYNWPAWEIMKETLDGTPQSLCSNASLEIVEWGPVRKMWKLSRTFGDSQFVQYITLREGADAERIDVRCAMDWNSSGCLLKAEFPMSFGNPVARYDLGTGSIERGNNVPNMYEVYAQKWADLQAQDGSYGVAIMSDCKYGWDKPSDNTLRLTLLHTPSTDGRYAYQDHQDLGHHEFTYSIVGHEGSVCSKACDICGLHNGGEASFLVRAQAEKLEQPLKAFFAPAHKGSLGRSYSFATVDGASLKAFKKAEDGNGYIVRVYDETGAGGKAILKFAHKLANVVEVNGIEEDICSVAADGERFAFDLKPFAVRSFRVNFADVDCSTGCAASASGRAAAVNGSALVPQQALDLPYTVRTASYNSMRNAAKFDSEGHSFAAELLPSEILHKGIRFPLANPFDANAMRCNGGEISLPAGLWNALYLLVSSNDDDQRVKFLVGGKEQEVTIPSWSGFVGQWGHKDHTEGFIKTGDITFVGTHKHDFKNDCDLAYEQTYLWCVRLDIPAGAKTVKLPENRCAMIFSAVVACDTRNVLEPCSELSRLGDVAIPYLPEPQFVEENGIFLCETNIIGVSGEVGDHECAAMMFDGDDRTKWCDAHGKSPKFVDIDLKAEKKISGYYIMHAAHESAGYVTKNFRVLVRHSLDEDWIVADEVLGNSDPFNDRPLDVTARYVRLEILQGQQSSTAGNTARIYEFQVY